MIIFVIELDLWDSNIVFLCQCFRISKWHISRTGGQSWLLKKAKSIPMIMFLIHMYLWGIDAVFLWRYPHISSRTIFELKGWNQVLAEANCSKSSLGWSYFQFTSICEELTLYLSGDIPIFLVGLTLNWEDEIRSGRSKLLNIIIRLILFLIHMYLWGTDAVFLWRYPHISGRTNIELGGWNQVLAEANCLKSSSGRSYWWWNWICEILIF